MTDDLFPAAPGGEIVLYQTEDGQAYLKREKRPGAYFAFFGACSWRLRRGF